MALLPTPPPLPKPLVDLQQPGTSSELEECSLTRPGSSLGQGQGVHNVLEAPAPKKQCTALDGSSSQRHPVQQLQQQRGGEGIEDDCSQQQQQGAGASAEGALVYDVDAAEAEAVEALLAAAAGRGLSCAQTSGSQLKGVEFSAGGSPRRSLQHDPAALQEFLALHASFNLPARRQHAMTASLRMLQCYRDAALEDPLHSEEIMAHTHRYAVLLRLLASDAPEEQTSITSGVLALAKRFLRELRSFRCIARRNMQGAGLVEVGARAAGTQAPAPCNGHELQEARARADAAEQRAVTAEGLVKHLWQCVQSLQQASSVAPTPGPAAAADCHALQQRLAAAQTELSALHEERQLVMAAGEYAVQLRQDLEQETEAAKQHAWAGAASLCRQMHEAYLLQQQQQQQQHGGEAGAEGAALRGHAVDCSSGAALAQLEAGARRQAEPRSSKESATAPPFSAAAAASTGLEPLPEMQQQGQPLSWVQR